MRDRNPPGFSRGEEVNDRIVELVGRSIDEMG